MESIGNDFAKLVGRVLAERWLQRQGISTDGRRNGIGKKLRTPIEARESNKQSKPLRRASPR